MPTQHPTAPQMNGDTTAAASDRERIAARAYELYQARGAGDGRAMDDWLDAEREISGGGTEGVTNGGARDERER